MNVVAKGDFCSNYSGLKSIISKCEISGMSALNSFYLEDGGLKSIYFLSDTLLGVLFHETQDLRTKKNFSKVILDIQNTLTLWSMGSLTIGGKIFSEHLH